MASNTCQASPGGRLAWAKANGCPWGLLGWKPRSNPCALAAEGGHQEVLQWARAHGCEWDERTCRAAAEGGHLDVMVWAREQHCPWSETTCRAAAEGAGTWMS